jgi:hypothetical protein
MFNFRFLEEKIKRKNDQIFAKIYCYKNNNPIYPSKK